MKAFILLPAFWAAALPVPAAPEPPVVADSALRVELFAQEPLIRQPIGATFTADGRLLVVESHTHFRPKKYDGPEHDRILWLEDGDGDGRADKASVFFEGTDMTMDLATAADGSIYLSTRNEILRMRDHDGKAEKVERKLVFLDTESRYPHNGLSGLAFDKGGGLYIGMGENLGGAYTITGSDGVKFSDQGEGGNIWHVTKDGGSLRRVATGFWNPWGLCVDPQGNVFATDNDPDSRPPCRLHHIIEGGDYGYQFRYGRSGLHPFISWNGELPGTLPMLAGTGEAPCGVKYYAPPPTPKFRGLPSLWHGTVLVASWADHTIDSYHLPDSAHASDTAKRTTLIQGGADFRPVAIAIAPDGSLFITDWVKREYELHGFGRVWHVSAKDSSALKGSYAEISGITHLQRQLDKIAATKKVTPLQAAEWLNDNDPWPFSAAVTRVAQDADLLKIMAGNRLPYPRQRAGFLLALRQAAPGGVPPNAPGAADFLSDSDNTVRLLALKWISDLRLADAKPAVEKMLRDENVTPELFYGAITALGRIESAEVNEAELVKRLKTQISDGATPPGIKRLALSILPDRERNVLARELEPLLQHKDAAFRVWIVHVLGTLRDQGRVAILRKLLADPSQPEKVRAAALEYVVVEPADIEPLLKTAKGAGARFQRAAAVALEGAALNDDEKEVAAQLSEKRGHLTPQRPPFGDIAAWKSFLDAVPGKPDIEHGREVFLSPRLGSCTLCHRADGLGAGAGPDLSAIGSAQSPDYVLESILQPSRNVAPRYECYSLQTVDGQTRVAFELIERGGTHTYVGLDGRPFEIKIEDIVKRERLQVSIMPEGLLGRMTDEEARDLLAFLKSRSSAVLPR
jgi:putative membrane-bound dehydrogenase-like protein